MNIKKKDNAVNHVKNKPHIFQKLEVRNWLCKTPKKYIFIIMLVEFLSAKQNFETETKKNYFNMAGLFGSVAHQTNILFHSYEYT